MSWLLLFPLWPFLWVCWRWFPQSSTHLAEGGETARASTSHRFVKQGIQLAAALLTALYMINCAYSFQGTFRPLKDAVFVSQVMTGHADAKKSGNRFATGLIGSLPIPVPYDFLTGLDTQNADFEHYGRKSYLRGVWKDGGWWYYYIYGLLVKVPCGTWALFALVIIGRFTAWRSSAALRDEFILLHLLGSSLDWGQDWLILNYAEFDESMAHQSVVVTGYSEFCQFCRFRQSRTCDEYVDVSSVDDFLSLHPSNAEALTGKRWLSPSIFVGRDKRLSRPVNGLRPTHLSRS
jgi:hypothetical protein